MVIEKTELDEVCVVSDSSFGFEGGILSCTFNKNALKEHGIVADFVEEKEYRLNKSGAFSGVYFQNHPYSQSKLIRCIKGSVLVVVVDLRDFSPQFRKWIKIELSKEKNSQLFVPHGFGCGFLALCDGAEIVIKSDEYDNKNSIKRINWFDKLTDIKSTDKKLPPLDDSGCNFGSRVLVTGVKGQLGYDVVRLLKQKGIQCLGVDIDDFDLTDIDKVNSCVFKYKPTAIVHCAAYTAVDKAEDDVDLCLKVNVLGTKNLAIAAEKIGAKFLYLSTDHVYSGEGEAAFNEDDKTAPLNVYGKTKLLGEEEVKKATNKHFIVRTSWIFGQNGNNFVKTMLKVGRENSEINIICDQIGSPTYTPDLSRLIVQMIFSEDYGTFNASNEGFCSWKEFADEVFSLCNIQIKTNAVTSAEYPAKAIRPLNSRLDKSKLEQAGFERLPPWQDALKRFLQNLI